MCFNLFPQPYFILKNLVIVRLLSGLLYSFFVEIKLSSLIRFFEFSGTYALTYFSTQANQGSNLQADRFEIRYQFKEVTGILPIIAFRFVNQNFEGRYSQSFRGQTAFIKLAIKSCFCYINRRKLLNNKYMPVIKLTKFGVLVSNWGKSLYLSSGFQNLCMSEIQKKKS